MNRQLKFRVWNEEEKKFYSINSDNYKLSYQGDIWIISKVCSTVEETLTSSRIFKLDSDKIQQFTGLKDVSGKDIYEGDIVKYIWEKYEHDSEEAIGQVFFENGIFLFDRKMEFATNDSNFITTSIEILGNIFENKELLK